MNEMTYNEWLEKELNIYKRENNLLNDKLENITTMFNEVHDNELETREKKNEILKWSYSLEKENKQLKQQIEGLTSENFELQNDLFTEQLNEDEADDYIESLKNELFKAHLLQQQQKQENEQLKDEIINLKTEIVDHRIKAYRLTKILNETSDYT